MDKMQRDDITIRKMPHGGYLVSDDSYARSGGMARMLFAGSLNDALEYVREALTFDDRCKSDGKTAPDKWSNVA
jgi:hypothetical protein